MADRMFEAFSIGKAASLPTKENGFKANLDTYANSVATNYMRYGLDMNGSIAKIASRDNLNSDQIKRVVEESNNRVYLAKYAQMKNSNDRDVVFDRADMEKIGTLITAKEGSDLNKIASVKDEPLNAYNATRKLTGAITPAAPTSLTKILAEKLASDLSTAAAERDKAHVDFDSHIYKVAEMMFRYDRAGIDTAAAFEEICRKNNFKVPVQNIIQEAADEIVSMEKKAGTIGAEYELKLPFVDTSMKIEDFGLGQFSKIASLNLEAKTAQRFPVMHVHGTVIHSVQDMVKFASHISALFDDVSKKEALFKTAEEKTTFNKEAGDQNAD